MDSTGNVDSSNIQAEGNSIAIGGLSVGGSVGGDIRIGHTIGYTSEQVSTLITQISTTFQPKPFDGRSPYKGLDVFEEEDAEMFFGREKLVQDLVVRVKESRTVFVTGPSGSGKSSLVRAGLIHALRQGNIKESNSDRWLYATLKPGRDPFEAMAGAFSRLKSPELGDYFLQNSSRADVLHKCAESSLSERSDQRLVLFIDQFEEIFTQLHKEKAQAFVEQLAHAADVENGRVIILFSMRSDFIPNCVVYPKLNAILNRQFVQIGAMQGDELVSAIAQPALRVGLRIDPDLIAQIINDMQGEPGALPLMQFALKDLFDAQQAKGGLIALTLSDYLARGGIRKALERHADNSFNRLNGHERKLTRAIFSSLIEIGRGTVDTRRTAIFDELVPASARSAEVEAIVRKLADARLLTTDEVSGQDTVTISHEKLIDAWPWLRRLVDENRDVISAQNEIAKDAKEWDDHGRDPSYLYSGARLGVAQEQLAANKVVLSGLSKEFLEEGIALREAERKTKEAMRRRIITGLTAGIAIALALAGFAVVQMLRAQTQTDIARARQLTAQAQTINATRNSKQMIAVLLATQSMSMSPSSEAAQILLNYNFSRRPTARMIYETWVTSAAFSPDGRYIVSGGCDEIDVSTYACTQGSARVWEALTGTEVARMIHGDWVRSVAFSPDGRYIVSGGCDTYDVSTYTCTQGSARVWEALTSTEVARMTHDYWVESVAFSPDGQYVVSGGCDQFNAGNQCIKGVAYVWETATGNEIARMAHDRPVTLVAFSPNGKYIVSGSGGTARVWEIATGNEIAHIPYDDFVNSVAFSTEGKYLVSGYQDHTVRVWETLTGKEVARMIHDDSVRSVAFSPDGKYLVSGSQDRTARVWEIATGKELARMTYDDVVNSVAFSPDGRYVISGSQDGTARVWEALTGKELARMTHDGPVNFVVFGPDSKYVISAGCDNYDAGTEGCTQASVIVWQATGENEVAPVTHEGWAIPATFSPDGRYIVSGGCDKYDVSTYTCTQGSARVWETLTGKEVAHTIHDEGVASVAFSPVGMYVISGGCDKHDTEYGFCIQGSARVWEAATGTEVARMTHDGDVNLVVFSPDGRYVVSAGCEMLDREYCHHATVRVWEALTGKEVARMTHDEFVHSVAFSPDGRYVVSAGCETLDIQCDHATARVWEALTGKEVANMTHNSSVESVAFSPNGRYVVSGSQDHTARVWEIATGKEVASMTHEHWVWSVAFSPDGKYVVSSGRDDKTARVWETLTGKEVARMTHDGDVIPVAFSPDGRYVVSGSGDMTARVWEAATGKEVARMTHDDFVSSVAFSPDGRYVVSGSNDGIAHVWVWQVEDLIANACAVMPRNLTRAEWKQYIGDILAYPTKQENAPCPNLLIEPEVTATPTAGP